MLAIVAYMVTLTNHRIDRTQGTGRTHPCGGIRSGQIILVSPQLLHM